ncbi:LysM peptidoglycan-binding domain-containing protein [Treponema denticola]|uniref:LysM peptidoglycan-binding domain-containing protein n=1 Tax=Treponema denticola TaxID=158 RepID=UPI0020A52278|nr:LysM peptidoglycan-binding domain-containing protein [Treponema denticola]UTD12956.1 LysM peptidoglycan-binding domain-containing protein [Treponema denticola]
MASKIGIKLADGTFFPILDEDALLEQSLELTTVRDDQESVQINLFKQVDGTEPEYIGSLIVEDVSTGAAGDPTINLKIKLDEEKNLSAEAVDEGSGSHQSLKVSLKNLDEASLEGLDFDFASFDDSLTSDDGLINTDDFMMPDESSSMEEMYQEESSSDSQLYVQNEEKSEKKKTPLWLIIIIIILCITALVFAILLLTKKMPFADKDKIASAPEKVEQVQEPKKDVNATTSNAPKENAEEKAAAEAKRKAEEEAKQKAEAEAKKKAEEEAKQKAEAEAKKKAEEEAKQKADAKKKADAQKKTNVNSKGVVRYKIKWGDTLWDLSETYYKTPWLYKKIADYNKIKNPNLIIAGTYIDIPPK